MVPNRNRPADVIVVGAGIVGAACAMSCADAGLRVLVVDRGAPVGGTSSHCEGNLLVSDKGPGAELVLAQRAAADWPRFVERARDELGPGFPDLEFEAKGGLVVANSARGLGVLEAFAAEQRTAGVTAESLALDEAFALEPDLSREVAGAIWYPQDAQVQPVIAAETMLAIARRHGAEVRGGVDVRGGIVEGGRLRGVRTSAGDLRAEHVIVAAGPWSGDVAASLGAPVPVVPRRGVVLVTSPMRQRVFHKVYDTDYVDAVGSSSETLMTSSVVESTPAGSVLIGSSREQIGFDDRLRTRVLAEIARKAVALFPFLRDVSVLRAYGGFRPYMPDHTPVIGPDARIPGLWHATGHEGAGVGLSLPTGVLLAALITGGSTPVDPAPFALERPALAPALDATATADTPTATATKGAAA